MKKLLVFAVALFGTYTIHAQIQGITRHEGSVEQYGKVEWEVELIANWSNPFFKEEVMLDLELTAPNGEVISQPAYYISGKPGHLSAWGARFTPKQEGKYHYRFVLHEAGQTIGETEMQVLDVRPSARKGFLGAGDAWGFRFDDGKPFRGLGQNLAWESRIEDDSRFFKELHEQEKFNYEYMVPRLKATGGNYFRTWICSWNLPLDWKTGINNARYIDDTAYFNSSAVEKLDRLVALCDSLDVYFMLTLGPGTHHRDHGRHEVSIADFFTDPVSKAEYRNRLRFIVGRWGYSPSIAAWEFFNEIDNIQFRDPEQPIPAEHIVQWHQEMAEYLSQIDVHGHLMTTSISHRDLDGLNSIPQIDFNQKHIYRNTSAIGSTTQLYVERFQKPYVIGEFGYEWDWQLNFDDFAEGMDSDYKRGLWYGLFSPTPILPLSWWWEYFENRGTDRYFNRVKVILDDMLASGGGTFTPIKLFSSSPDIEVYGVQCGSKTYIYLYNPTGEVRETDLEVRWSAQMLPGERRIYDCESGDFFGLDGLRLDGEYLRLLAYPLPAHTDRVLVLE